MNNPSLGVWSGLEDGGLGITVDPDFADNGWIYVYYAPLPASHNANRLSRLTVETDADGETFIDKAVGEGHPRGRHAAQRLLPLRRLGAVRRRRRAAPRHGRQHLVLRQRRLLPPRRADRAVRLRRAEVLGQHQRPARQDPARHPPQRRRRRREPDRRGRHLVRHPRGQPVRRGRRLPVRALPRRRPGEDAARDLRDGPAQPLPARRGRRHRRPLLGRGRPGLARQQPQPRSPPLRGVQPHRGRDERRLALLRGRGRRRPHQDGLRRRLRRLGLRGQPLPHQPRRHPQALPLQRPAGDGRRQRLPQQLRAADAAPDDRRLDPLLRRRPLQVPRRPGRHPDRRPGLPAVAEHRGQGHRLPGALRGLLLHDGDEPRLDQGGADGCRGQHRLHQRLHERPRGSRRPRVRSRRLDVRPGVRHRLLLRLPADQARAHRLRHQRLGAGGPRQRRRHRGRGPARRPVQQRRHERPRR